MIKIGEYVKVYGNEVPPLMGRLGFLETFDTEFLKRHAVIFRE